uniref:Uncharacterized protein n=1 Tax=Anguilla anguilla TaxID=7936 RepID=A0A0E9U050_ANGAN
MHNSSGNGAAFG